MSDKKNILYSTQLFLGIIIDADIERALQCINPSLKALLIQSADLYLTEIEFNNQKMLGKFAGKITDLPALEQLRDNIFSHFKKLLPSYSLSSDKMLLVAIPENE